MKQEIIKPCIYIAFMLILLQLSLLSTDVFISHIFAAFAVMVGAFAFRLLHNQTKIKHE